MSKHCPGATTWQTCNQALHVWAPLRSSACVRYAGTSALDMLTFQREMRMKTTTGRIGKASSFLSKSKSFLPAVYANVMTDLKGKNVPTTGNWIFSGTALSTGPGVAQWLRHCATSRAVPASNPGGVGHRDFSRGYRQNHVPWGQLSL